ncbi:MAG: DUF3391 domain-containing protein [Propionivibrio sp.]
MQKLDQLFVTADQLQIGLYVHLDLKWFEHPFAFNNFKIKDQEQIAIIRDLGIKKIRVDPARSDLKPVPREPAQPVGQSEAKAPVPTEHPALAAKRTLIEKIRQQREAFNANRTCVRRYREDHSQRRERPAGPSRRNDRASTPAGRPDRRFDADGAGPGHSRDGRHHRR